MKSTYCLPGVFWDGKTPTTESFRVRKDEETLLDFKYDFELFDTKRYIRKIRISEFLSAENADDAERIVEKLKHCDEILVTIDCFLSTRNETLDRFVWRRVSQILHYLRQRLPDIDIRIDRNIRRFD